jgi:bifunctional N-acetylglucosamine-1-phosphate-uridyltransferase/glucosamine-1-phosphate-acetyltransferase GlmU-like protein
MLSGVAASSAGKVRFFDPTTVWIDTRTEIGDGSVILPGVSIRGTCTIETEVSIDSGSVIEDSYIEHGAQIGIGNIFRRARIGARTKVPYKAQLADIEIGPDTNMANRITVSNFDGLRKNKTRIGAGCFIGTDVNINGGVKIGDEVRIYPKLFITTKYISNHAWVKDCRCENKFHRYHIEPNRSFKIPEHWRWVVTRKPVDPNRMHDLLRELGEEFRGKSEDLVNFWEKEGQKLERPFYLPEK